MAESRACRLLSGVSEPVARCLDFILLRFSRELAIALHREEERLYNSAQQLQQQQQPQQQQAPRDESHPSLSKPGKKSKTKQRKPAEDDEHKESCTLS